VKRSRNKKRRNVQLPLAAMGDIAFLLIIFFMLCTEFAKDKKLPLELPKSAEVKKTEAAIAAHVAIDENGLIYLDGREVERVEDIENGVRRVLAKTVSDDQRHIQFKCDAKLTKDTFEPVIKAIAEAGGKLEAVGEEPQ